MRKSLLIALSTAMILALPLSSNAETVQAEDLTVKEIIDSLYENEPQSQIRDCALVSSQVMTGEIPCERYKEYINIGRYNDVRVQDFGWLSVILGTGNFRIGEYPSGDFLILLKEDNTPTEERMAYNRKCLNLLYDTAQDMKSATAGMDARQTAAYIYNWIVENMHVVGKQDCRTATRLELGYGDCDGLSGLFYMFAINCGLTVRPAHGRVCGEKHAWVEMLDDGEWKVVDMTVRRLLEPISGEYADACREGCRRGVKLGGAGNEQGY